MASVSEITKILTGLVFLPNCPIEEGNAADVVESYHRVLGDLDAGILQAAADSYLAGSVPFFPTPGLLREKVVELVKMGAGIPTAGEAWAMFLEGFRNVSPVWCDEGARLRDAIEGQQGRAWADAVAASRAHDLDCLVCAGPGEVEEYGHPAVAETVRRLGGRSAILTGNPMSDRARFQDAFREVIAKVTQQLSLPITVHAMIESQQARLVSGQIQDLAGLMSVGGK